MKSGIELIAEERKRQIEVEKWDDEHDSEHWQGELVDAAICYAMHKRYFETNINDEMTSIKVKIDFWPWENNWWKLSSDKIKNLVKAGALIAAEIDRLQSSKTKE